MHPDAQSPPTSDHPSHNADHPEPRSSQEDATQETSAQPTGPFVYLRRLPQAVLEVPYIDRTRALLARRRARVAFVRAQTRQEIREFFKDIDHDLRESVERFEGTARKRADGAWQDFVKTSVGQKVEELFVRKTKSAS